MYGLRVANRYAKALLEYALLQNALEGVFADMTLIDKTIKMNKDLERMLISPIVKTTVKKNVLTEIFTMVTPETQRLFDLLIQNRRLPILGAVAEKFVVLYNDYKHNKTAVVTTASPLNEATRKEILEKVMMLTKNKNVTLDNKVDKNIIGGFILRVDDVQYNASVAHKLNRLQQEFPALAELMALSVTAGESALGALERICRTSNGELSREFSDILAQTRTGSGLLPALYDFARRTQVPALNRFVDGVAVAIERGTPLADVLRAQAQDARDNAKRELMETAGKKEIAMLAPVVFFILPLTVVFAIFPGLSLLHLTI